MLLYITGLFALNLECSLGTTGDWHMSGMDWSKLTLADSNNSIFGTYGIERNSTRLVPKHESNPHNIANHIRACLDLIEQENYCAAEGIYRDFLDEDDRYNADVFAHVLYLIKTYPNRFDEINRFMAREYGTKWIFFITRKGYDASCKSKCSDGSVLEDDIRSYPIDTLAQMKMTAFMSRNRIRDLYDVLYITNNYWEELSQPIQRLYRTGFLEKGIEQFDLICATQDDDLIDKDSLAESFLKALDKAKIAHTTEEIRPYRSLAEEMAAARAAANNQQENNDTTMRHRIKH